MTNEDVETIDMSVEASVVEAERIATNASNPNRWCQCETAAVHACAKKDMLWTVQTGPDGDEKIVAVTGDGPASFANAEFFVHARRVVLGLIARVRELELQLASDPLRKAALKLGAARARCGGEESFRVLHAEEALDAAYRAEQEEEKKP